MGDSDARTLGAAAEREALDFLLDNGLVRIANNYRVRGGEIDLVMQDKGCLVFIEVRCRSARRFVPSTLTVDFRKQKKLLRAARLFLARHGHYANSPVRFDVLGIDIQPGGERSIEWIRDAFRPGESTY